MIKLFKKLSMICTTTLVAFCEFACTADNPYYAGTAEEPNQFSLNEPSSSQSELIGTESSSSQKTEPSPHNNPESSSSFVFAPSKPSSSSSGDLIPYSYDTGHSPIPTSSSNRAGISSSARGNGGGGHAGSDTTSTSTLDDYLRKYAPSVTTVIGGAASDYAFDSNVLAYNVVYESCDLTKDTCSKSNEVPEYQTVGLHKIATENIGNVSAIFSKTAKLMGGSLKSSEGCSLYLLNMDESSPAVHVITEITKDSIFVVNIMDGCDYEKMPFDRYVGFLFEFCEEFSNAPAIIENDIWNRSMNYGGIEYKEYVKQVSF